MEVVCLQPPTPTFAKNTGADYDASGGEALNGQSFFNKLLCRRWILDRYLAGMGVDRLGFGGVDPLKRKARPPL
ncbi:hypothetical protein T265_04974 [Opisthorchis viverrini]|uniref:Uncharacterized protein n=1 Tax=Opisthorchis viverrini TaxID=6198 RepID=A0A074ZLC1_OPIVI|nr:hypothetical protein T265_04974 [Opisthorchis viverrini]KER28143.1 hypothetical protein T265_04974 [Opisthorchis viverrini]